MIRAYGVRMADTQQKSSRFHVRRGGLAEVKKITDPYEFAVAAADFLGTQPIAVPPGFSPAAELLCEMKTQREYVAEAYLAGKAEAGNMISLPEWRDKAPPKASWDRK